jgi:uncharacterized protein (TIGR02284 family)
MTDILPQLVTIFRASERRFYHATEHVRNRGLKLLLKSYTQQHARFAEQLIHLMRPANEEQAPAVAGDALERGWSDIQTTMIVRRQDRQRHVLTTLADEEERTLQQFAQALQAPLPADVLDMLRRQYVELDRMQRQLRLLAEASDRRILVRLFNDADKAEAVITHLKEEGFDPRSDLSRSH